MRRRDFTLMITSSSVLTLAGCNDLKRSISDSNESPEDGESTTEVPKSDSYESPEDGESTTEVPKSDSSSQPVMLSIDDVTNIYANNDGSPALNSELKINIKNPNQSELDINIAINIDGEETVEASIPAESSSTIPYDTMIDEQGDYEVVIHGEIKGEEQYDIKINEETIPEITFATPSIVQSYTSDGMGQNSPTGFGADRYAAQDAKGLLENEQEVGGFGARLQNVQKIQCEFPDEYESGKDPQCRIKDIGISGDLIYIYNQWRNEDPLVSSTENQLGFSVCAVDIWSGEEIWEKKFGKNVEIEGGVDREGPGLLSVDDEHLFYSAQDGIHALDRETGTEIWSFNADSTNQIFLIENMLLTFTDSLYAIDSETGEEKWSTDESAVILAGNEGTIITKSSGRIESIDIEDGSLNWSFDSFSEPGLSNDCAHTGSKVFVTADVKFNVEAGPMGLYCLDAQTGEKLWRQPVSTAYEIPGLARFANSNNIPLVEENEGVIYVDGSGGSDDEFGFQCYDIESGELIWRNNMVFNIRNEIATTSIAQGIKAGDYMYGSQDIADVTKDFMNEKQVETRLISRNVITTIDRDQDENYPQTHDNLRPLFAHGALFYVYDDLFKDYIRVFTGCSANSGATGECTTDTSTSEPKETATEPEWTFDTDDEVWSSPAVKDDTVYVGNNGGTVYALDAADGTEQWTVDTGDTVRSSPAVVAGTVYVGNNGGTVYALDAADGTEQWTFDTGDAVRSSPAVVDGTVYVGSGDGSVYAMDAADGTEQWIYDTDRLKWVNSSPAVVDGTVYVGSGDDTVYALDAADGTEQWTFDTEEFVNSSPAVVDGTVYVGSADGNVYALTVQ